MPMAAPRTKTSTLLAIRLTFTNPSVSLWIRWPQLTPIVLVRLIRIHLCKEHSSWDTIFSSMPLRMRNTPRQLDFQLPMETQNPFFPTLLGMKLQTRMLATRKFPHSTRGSARTLLLPLFFSRMLM